MSDTVLHHRPSFAERFAREIGSWSVSLKVGSALMAIIVLAAEVYFFLVFLHQHYPSAVPNWAHSALGEEIAGFPYVGYVFWVAILLVVFNLFVTLRGLRKSFARKEREHT